MYLKFYCKRFLIHFDPNKNLKNDDVLKFVKVGLYMPDNVRYGVVGAPASPLQESRNLLTPVLKRSQNSYPRQVYLGDLVACHSFQI